MRDELNRREVLAGITAATTSGVASVGNARALSETRSFSSSTGNLDTDATFTLINSPTTKGFNDVVETATGPYALAGGGKLFHRTPSGWEVVFDGGIQGNGKTLVAGDTGSEGRRLWIVGSSGVVGAYDTVRKELTDYSKPKNVTNTWTGISVIGAPGAETIILVNSSGQVLRGQVSVCGDVTWGTIKKPSGNGIYGIDNSHFHNRRFAGGSGTVYQQSNDGGSWSKVGISNVGKTLQDIAMVSSDLTTVVGNGGLLATYDGDSWTSQSLSPKAINEVDHAGKDGLAVGNDGRIYSNSGSGWSQIQELDTSANLEGAMLDETGEYPEVAVGNSGTIAERGSYSSSVSSHRLVVQGKGNKTVDYEIWIDGYIHKTDTSNSGVSISSCSGSTLCKQITGTVTGAGQGEKDIFNFAGELKNIRVTDGDARSLLLHVDGESVDINRIAESDWTKVDSPVSVTLHTVTAGAESIYAAGGSGKLLQRTNNGWKELLKSGIGGNGNNYYSSAASTSSRIIWFGGSSGALGSYDTIDETITDHSAPNNMTGSWKSLEVLGPRGQETIYAGDSNGQILIGEKSSTGVDWNDPSTPGSGSTIVGIEFRSQTHGFFCDTNGDVFETTDGGSSWTKIGIPNSNTPQSIAFSSSQGLFVSAGSGTSYRYDGTNWTPIGVGSGTNQAIDTKGSRRAIAANGGHLFELETTDMVSQETPTTSGLRDVCLTHNNDLPAIAVGGSGTILEKEFSDNIYQQ